MTAVQEKFAAYKPNIRKCQQGYHFYLFILFVSVFDFSAFYPIFKAIALVLFFYTFFWKFPSAYSAAGNIYHKIIVIYTDDYVCAALKSLRFVDTRVEQKKIEILRQLVRCVHSKGTFTKCTSALKLNYMPALALALNQQREKKVMK